MIMIQNGLSTHHTLRTQYILKEKKQDGKQLNSITEIHTFYGNTQTHMQTDREETIR